MKVLITSAASDIGRQIKGALDGRFDLRLTDLSADAAGEPGNVAAELGHDRSTDRLLSGVDAVVHPGYPIRDGSPSELIDYLARCTYNLSPTVCPRACGGSSI